MTVSLRAPASVSSLPSPGAKVVLGVRACDYADAAITDFHVTLKHATNGQTLASGKAGAKGWYGEIPPGVHRIVLEISGKDAHGEFFPMRRGFEVQPGGLLTTAPDLPADSLASLASDAGPQGKRLELRVWLPRTRVKQLSGFSGVQKRSYTCLRDPQQLASAWQLDFGPGEDQAECVLYETALAHHPKYIAVAFPQGLNDFSRMLVFFHPNPGQNDFLRGEMHAKGYPAGLEPMIRGYLVDDRHLAMQLTRSRRRAALVMPVVPGSDLGQLKHAAVAQAIFMELGFQLRNLHGNVPKIDPIQHMALASFSIGSTCLKQFLASRPQLPIQEVYDFDSDFTSDSIHSVPEGMRLLKYNSLGVDYRKVLRGHPAPYPQSDGWKLDALRGVFHLPTDRWRKAYDFLPVLAAQLKRIHQLIPNHMLFHALAVSRCFS